MKHVQEKDDQTNKVIKVLDKKSQFWVNFKVKGALHCPACW